MIGNIYYTDFFDVKILIETSLTYDSFKISKLNEDVNKYIIFISEIKKNCKLLTDIFKED